jgi:ATP-dependent protease ClpP protease subunit
MTTDMRGSMDKRWWWILPCLLPLGCQRVEPAPPAHPPVVTLGNEDGSAVTRARTAPPPADYLAGTHWPAARLHEGNAWISCAADYDAQGDGHPVGSLDFLALVDTLSPCRESGLLRLRYRGNIGPGFTALVERVAAIARRMGIGERILDIDSPGGQVEEALLAGDAIAGSQWAIWVRKGSICHSACVLVLAAGDTRSIEGRVGIHRLMRQHSRATTRRELSAELADITEQVRDYLARNGVAGALADQMMTIPNRDLRILTGEELAQFGLSGTNAVQDDLERITLMRQCGDDFVRRHDAFMRDFDAQCMKPGDGARAVQACGHGLEQRFGFPDRSCAGHSPMDEYAQRVGQSLPTASEESSGHASGHASGTGSGRRR